MTVTGASSAPTGTLTRIVRESGPDLMPPDGRRGFGSGARARLSSPLRAVPAMSSRPACPSPQQVRTSARGTGRCSRRESVHASAIQPASSASPTVQGEGRVPATTSVNAVSSAR